MQTEKGWNKMWNPAQNPATQKPIKKRIKNQMILQRILPPPSAPAPFPFPAISVLKKKRLKIKKGSNLWRHKAATAFNCLSISAHSPRFYYPTSAGVAYFTRGGKYTLKYITNYVIKKKQWGKSSHQPLL